MKAKECAPVALREKVQAVVTDLIGQAAAIQAAVRGPEVNWPARDAALARAGGMRDAAGMMQQLLRGNQA